MQIDKSNYEIWFIDWLDGNLDSLQAEQLRLFLNENPDLREEFNDLTPLSLVPSGNSFPHKVQLKKLPSDISLSQFEYLSAAYLENDLSDRQQSELKDIIDVDPYRKMTFDLIQKTRLSPAFINYKNKSSLMKQTVFQKVVRLAVIGLSTAAMISVVILTYSVIPRKLSSSNNNAAQTIVIDSNLTKPSSEISAVKGIAHNISVSARQKRETRLTGIQKGKRVMIKSDSVKSLMNDTMVRSIYNQEIIVNKVPVYIQADLIDGIINNTLIASGTTLAIQAEDDERSNIGRFISRAFRQKILKEKSASDRPLQGYEIAEAGVTGLNKLLGWEMALDRKNDENGELRSVYFSSKILKFNAPVKKSKPLQ